MNRTVPSSKWLLVCIFLLMAALLACNLPPLSLAEPASADLGDLEAALNAETEDNRPEILAQLGLPDAFDISIVEVEGVKVRMESWRYYQYATRIDFVDGEAVWTIAIDPMPEGTIFAAWYDPMEFRIGMTAAEASQLIAAVSPAEAEPELIDLSEGGEELSGGSALVGDQIMIGLEEDQVIYVETIALMPAGGGQ